METTRMTLLKCDLQMVTNANDIYLESLIELAEEYIGTEGIKLKDGNIPDDLLVSMYAAHLFRKRAGKETSMPRFLRVLLNEKLFGQKMKGGSDGGNI
jgi:hypothetical protein